MPKIRIQARETVSYCKEMEVDQETLDNFIELATCGDNTVGGSDFNLHPEDIDSGELEADEVEIDVFVDGKWKSAFTD